MRIHPKCLFLWLYSCIRFRFLELLQYLQQHGVRSVPSYLLCWRKITCRNVSLINSHLLGKIHMLKMKYLIHSDQEKLCWYFTASIGHFYIVQMHLFFYSGLCDVYSILSTNFIILRQTRKAKGYQVTLQCPFFFSSWYRIRNLKQKGYFVCMSRYVVFVC